VKRDANGDRETNRMNALLLILCTLILTWVVILARCGPVVAQTTYGTPGGTCDLADVDCSALADDYYLRYDAATDTWIPETIDLSPFARLDGTTPYTGDLDLGGHGITRLGSIEGESGNFRITPANGWLESYSAGGNAIFRLQTDDPNSSPIMNLFNSANDDQWSWKLEDSTPAGAMLFEFDGDQKIVFGTDGSIALGGNLFPAERLDLRDASGNGAIRVGNTASANAGTFRWTGSDFEGYTGTAWESLTPQDLSGYALLDGSNGPTTGVWTFADDIQGPVSGCTAATTLFIDSGPAHCNAAVCGVELDADLDGLDACAPGEGALNIWNDDGDGVPATICEPGAATDILAAFALGSSTFTFGADEIRLCIIDGGGGPGPYVSFLISSDESCDTLNTSIGAAGVVYSDDEYFTFNSDICTYDYTPDAGLSLVAGWNSPPTITTDSAPIPYWAISDTGVAHFAGDVGTDSDIEVAGAIGVGDIPASVTGYNQSGVLVHKTYTDFSESTYRGPGDPDGENYLRAGLRFGIYLNPAEAYDGSGSYQIGYGTQGVVLTGTSNRMAQIFGALNQAYVGGTNQVVDVVTGLNSQIGTVGVGSQISAGRLFNGDIPFTNGTFVDLTGLRIPDLGYKTTGAAVGVDIEGFTGEDSDGTGIRIGDLATDGLNIGVDIAAFTNASGNDFGIRNMSPWYQGGDLNFLPDLPAETGTTQAVCVDVDGKLYVGTCG